MFCRLICHFIVHTVQILVSHDNILLSSPNLKSEDLKSKDLDFG